MLAKSDGTLAYTKDTLEIRGIRCARGSDFVCTLYFEPQAFEVYGLTLEAGSGVPIQAYYKEHLTLGSIPPGTDRNTLTLWLEDQWETFRTMAICYSENEEGLDPDEFDPFEDSPSGSLAWENLIGRINKAEWQQRLSGPEALGHPGTDEESQSLIDLARHIEEGGRINEWLSDRAEAFRVIGQVVSPEDMLETILAAIVRIGRPRTDLEKAAAFLRSNLGM